MNRFSKLSCALAVGLGALCASLTQAQTVAGPFVNGANGHSYFVIRIASWDDYRQAAQSRGGYPVVINDAAENAWILNTLVLPFVPTSFFCYIGLDDTLQEGDWRWNGVVDGYRNWAPGEPNNFAGMQDFAMILRNGLWDDFIAPPPDNGQGLQYAIVEVDGPGGQPKGVIAGPVRNPANNTDYYLIAPSNFSQARNFAIEQLRGELVRIDSAAENDFITRSLLDFPGIGSVVRIGLNDIDGEGQYRWTSAGTPLATYFRWDIGEPNNSLPGAGEDFVTIYTAFPPVGGRTGFWNDTTDAVRASIVEVVRCKADFNESGSVSVQDVFDYLTAYFSGCP